MKSPNDISYLIDHNLESSKDVWSSYEREASYLAMVSYKDIHYIDGGPSYCPKSFFNNTIILEVRNSTLAVRKQS